MDGGGRLSRVHRVVAGLSCLAAFAIVVIVVVKPVYDRAPAKPSSLPVEPAPPAAAPPPKPSLDGELTPRVVRVTVTSPDGTPIPGAVARALPVNRELPEQTGRTDDAGRCALGLTPDVTYTIRVEHEDFESAEVPGVRGGGEPLRSVLVPKKSR